MREQVIRICVDLDRVAEAGFACRSQGAGGRARGRERSERGQVGKV
jgi:hypothetical protein